MAKEDGEEKCTERRMVGLIEPMCSADSTFHVEWGAYKYTE